MQTTEPITDLAAYLAEVEARVQRASDEWPDRTEYLPALGAWAAVGPLHRAGGYPGGGHDAAGLDSEFASHAVKDIPTLLAIVRRLAGERDEAQAALTAFLARYDNHIVRADLLFADIAELARAVLARCQE